MGFSTMRKQRHSCQLSRDHLTCISEDKMLQEAESICRERGGEWWELLIIIRWVWLWKLSITLSMWGGVVMN
jgi:hypothetical protein